jgi:hypothetical protein
MTRTDLISQLRSAVIEALPLNTELTNGDLVEAQEACDTVFDEATESDDESSTDEDDDEEGG